MKEAIGTSMVFNLIIIFVAIALFILVGSISFSKGFKIRNRIIDRIEEYEGYNIENGSIEAIENDLKAIGYKIVPVIDNKKCKERNGQRSLTEGYSGQYNYCVYEFGTSKGNYYGVTVFISFDIPFIGSYIEIPIYGETRIIFDKGQVQG